jgi:hypothetical protein
MGIAIAMVTDESIPEKINHGAAEIQRKYFLAKTA